MEGVDIGGIGLGVADGLSGASQVSAEPHAAHSQASGPQGSPAQPSASGGASQAQPGEEEVLGAEPGQSRRRAESRHHRQETEGTPELLASDASGVETEPGGEPTGSVARCGSASTASASSASTGQNLGDCDRRPLGPGGGHEGSQLSEGLLQVEVEGHVRVSGVDGGLDLGDLGHRRAIVEVELEP